MQWHAPVTDGNAVTFDEVVSQHGNLGAVGGVLVGRVLQQRVDDPTETHLIDASASSSLSSLPIQPELTLSIITHTTRFASSAIKTDVSVHFLRSIAKMMSTCAAASRYGGEGVMAAAAYLCIERGAECADHVWRRIMYVIGSDV